jgi:signal transduction histidine kinase
MAIARVLRERRPVQYEDMRETQGYREGVEPIVKVVEIGGARSILAVPMIKEDRAVGAIMIYRAEVRRFTEKQIDLVTTFASQAVIAIENVRLFKELESRTEALTKSVGQLTALGEVGQAISSTLDLEKVLKTIVQHAVQLTGLDGGSIYEYDESTEQFALKASENIDAELMEAVRRTPVRKGEGAIGRCAVTQEPEQVPEILDDSYQTGRKELLVRAGYRAILAVPLLREGHLLGALQVFRRTPGSFAEESVELLKTFATQSAMAIQNARLFREIAEKSRELEEASKHKSQFLASMSHELRTPLNAILGFNEMLLGEVYGPLSEDMQPPLAQMQTSGKHLLRLINNVLDLAKIEAGRMELALSDYSVHDTVESVRATLRPLAEAKGLDFVVELPPDLPLAHGDPGRITQCLMNLAGNSLKFTKAGKVAITVAASGGRLVYRVSDTGIGIPADKIGSLFTEFRQTDATIASEFGGTGLGLSISKKFIEMHGGRIWAESAPGEGSTFIFEIPLRAGEEKTA